MDQEYHDNEGRFECDWCGIIIEDIDNSDYQYWHYDDSQGCHEICNRCYHTVKWNMGKPIKQKEKGLMNWI